MIINKKSFKQFFIDSITPEGESESYAKNVFEDFINTTRGSRIYELKKWMEKYIYYVLDANEKSLLN